MQTYLKEKLKKYAEEKEKISAIFYIKNRNQSEEFIEIYTVVEGVIVSRMLEEIQEIFDDIILTNKKKQSFRLNKKMQNYTILEVFLKNGIKISETLISSEFANDFIKNMPNDLVFIYDKINLEDSSKENEFSYQLPKEYEFESTIRQFFAYSLETSFFLVERNQIAASFKLEKMRSELVKLIDWYIIDKFSNKKNAGYDYENILYSLDQEYKLLLMETFSSNDFLGMFNSIFKAAALFRKLGLLLEEKLGYSYLKKEDVESLKLLRINYKKIESLVQ